MCASLRVAFAKQSFVFQCFGILPSLNTFLRPSPASASCPPKFGFIAIAAKSKSKPFAAKCCGFPFPNSPAAETLNFLLAWRYIVIHSSSRIFPRSRVKRFCAGMSKQSLVKRSANLSAISCAPVPAIHQNCLPVACKTLWKLSRSSPAVYKLTVLAWFCKPHAFHRPLPCSMATGNSVPNTSSSPKARFLPSSQFVAESLRGFAKSGKTCPKNLPFCPKKPGIPAPETLKKPQKRGFSWRKMAILGPYLVRNGQKSG